MRVGIARGPAAKADVPVACVLAQLSQAGQMVAVTADQLNAYLTGVLSAQGASVAILNGVPVVSVSGATFFVGYGQGGASMLNGGLSRSTVTIPGSLTCAPQPPQTGWWWNPLEDGRGFSLEVRGNNLFFAAFLYDISGRSTWYVSTGPASLDGTYYSGDLLAASGGRRWAAPTPASPRSRALGGSPSRSTTRTRERSCGAGGTVAIQRFNIVPNGLNLAPVAGQPESGWWWNEQEAGRGFFLEWQGGNLDIAGYMYDDAGKSVWYLTTGPIGGSSTARSFAGNWWSFADGQGRSRGLMRNEGAGIFTDITVGSGMDRTLMQSIEWVTHDFNNDGLLDISGGGYIMINLGDFQFVPNSFFPGPGGVGDVNNDGTLDVSGIQGLQLGVPNGNHWLRIALHGVVSNSEGIGARITVEQAGGQQIREVRSGDGFRYMSSIMPHFGLGSDHVIERITVRWPPGVVQVVEDFVEVGGF